MAVVLEDRAAVVLETALTDTVPRWKRHGPRHMEDVEVFALSGWAWARRRMLLARGWHVVGVEAHEWDKKGEKPKALLGMLHRFL